MFEVKIEEEDYMEVLLNNMPSNYNNIHTILRKLPLQTLETIIFALLEEEQNMSNIENIEQAFLLVRRVNKVKVNKTFIKIVVNQCMLLGIVESMPMICLKGR